jgi:hypothetical protein
MLFDDDVVTDGEIREGSAAYRFADLRGYVKGPSVLITSTMAAVRNQPYGN